VGSTKFLAGAISSRCSCAKSLRLVRGCLRFLALPAGALRLPGFRRPSSTRANRRIRRPLRTLCEAWLGTRPASGLFVQRDSWSVSTWQRGAAGSRLPALRACVATGDRTSIPPMQSSLCAQSDPRAALLPSVLQRECRVRIRHFSWFAGATLHFSTYLPTFNFALSTFLPWRFPCVHEYR